MKQNKSPQSCSSGGFLARYGELFHLGCCCLSSAAQPFAYVVANYVCYHGDKKCDEYFFHETHLLSAGGSTALLVYHGLEQNGICTRHDKTQPCFITLNRV